MINQTQSLLAIGTLIFFVQLSIFSNRGGHVWWKFESLTIIHKEDHNCIISLKFGNNWQNLQAFLYNFCIFSNGGGHVWWWLKLSTIILKGNRKCIIFLKSESNWPFSGFFRIFFIEMFLKFSFFNNGGGHVWWRFRSSTIILKENRKCIISSLEAIAPSHTFAGFFNWIFFVDFAPIFYLNGSHVGWSAGTSETIFKLDTLRMIVAKFGSNWFGGFKEEDFWKGLHTDDDGRTTDAKWWQ